MSDFIVRFDGVELSEEQKQKIESAIQKAVADELTSSGVLASAPAPHENYVVVQAFPPTGPTHHGGSDSGPRDPGGIGTAGTEGGGRTGGGTVTGKKGLPIWKLVPMDITAAAIPQWPKKWMGIIFVDNKVLAANPKLAQRQLTVKEQ
jgi:hypothetical protein